MTIRKPLVLVDGVISQLPDTDTLLAELDKMGYQEIIEFDDVNNYIYKGWYVPPVPAANEAVFRIQRIAFIGANEKVEKIWAGDEEGFVHRWDQRENLTYPVPV